MLCRGKKLLALYVLSISQLYVDLLFNFLYTVTV